MLITVRNPHKEKIMSPVNEAAPKSKLPADNPEAARREPAEGTIQETEVAHTPGTKAEDTHAEEITDAENNHGGASTPTNLGDDTIDKQNMTDRPERAASAIQQG